MFLLRSIFVGWFCFIRYLLGGWGPVAPAALFAPLHVRHLSSTAHDLDHVIHDLWVLSRSGKSCTSASFEISGPEHLVVQNQGLQPIQLL